MKIKTHFNIITKSKKERKLNNKKANNLLTILYDYIIFCVLCIYYNVISFYSLSNLNLIYVIAGYWARYNISLRRYVLINIV